MAIHDRDEERFADTQADLPEVLRRYSVDSYPAEHFADAVCACGRRVFELLLDEKQGVAIRICRQCGLEHPLCDSGNYLDAAELETCVCTCGAEELEITVGVALHENSATVFWLYLGCRCPACGLAGCYADWKNEFDGYQELLAHV